MSNSIKPNYKKPERVDKRLRYISGWSPDAQDLIDEQNYHVVRKWSHNRWLHTPGICEGLAVSVENGQLKVSAGTAVDGKGRQIVLVEKTDPRPDLKSNKGKTVLLYVCYREEDLAAPHKETSAPEGNKRWHEKPRFGIADQKDLTENQVALAGLVIDEKGGVKGEPDTSVRQYAGVRLPGGEADRKGVTLRSTDAGQVEFGGELHVSKDLKVHGKVGIGMPVASAELDVKGTVKATKFTGDGSDLQVGNGFSVKKALSKKVDDTTFKTKLGDKVDTITFNTALGKKVDKNDFTTELGKKIDSTRFDTALNQKAALNGLPDQDFHANVIIATQIVTTHPIDSVPHWDSEWQNVVLSYPEFTHTCEHNLGVIPSRYTLQLKAQNAQNDVHILTGGGVVTFELDMVDTVGGKKN